ncbi:melanocortin-2 receptor accessory protein 2 [Cricetulus griseus]|nr:melanocortin-2 receptor accessory protein 2 [Cricetulus griseus]
MEMSAQRLMSNKTSLQSASNSDYTWEYEYYEIGPVSFEGLKAHKYCSVASHGLKRTGKIALMFCDRSNWWNGIDINWDKDV